MRVLWLLPLCVCAMIQRGEGGVTEEILAYP